MAGPRARGLCTSKPTAGRGAKGTGRGCPGAHATPWPGLGPSILQCPAGVGGQGVSRSPGRRGPAVQQRQLGRGAAVGLPRGQLQTQRPEGTLPVHGRPTVQVLGTPRCWKLLPTIASVPSSLLPRAGPAGAPRGLPGPQASSQLTPAPPAGPGEQGPEVGEVLRTPPPRLAWGHCPAPLTVCPSRWGPLPLLLPLNHQHPGQGSPPPPALRVRLYRWGN